MFFADEREAFDAYADAMPNNCVFLVDTYDTLAGVDRAIEVGRALRARGHEMVGVRLDSGDLAYLSIEARRRLDAAGFPDAAVVASNDLDEHVISSLKEQGAAIGVWGVGTKLVTAYDQPALGGVYKLAAVREPDTSWTYKIKLSEQPIKISNPGIQQVRRYYAGGQMIGDRIYDAEDGVTAGDGSPVWDIDDPARRHRLGASDRREDLLIPVFRGGAAVISASLADARQRAAAQLEALSARSRRFLNPHVYRVGLDPAIHDRKRALIAAARADVARRSQATDAATDADPARPPRGEREPAS
jgi:nicotinate phosphoribosyltransferase